MIRIVAAIAVLSVATLAWPVHQDGPDRSRSVAATSEPGQSTGGCQIKGNISRYNDERIYHVPGGQYYERTVIDPSNGERWFCSEAEARSAGWRRSKR